MDGLKLNYAAARVNANLTQNQAAELIGVSRDALISYENGKTEPKASTLQKMAEVYGISLDTFFIPSITTLSSREEEDT